MTLTRGMGERRITPLNPKTRNGEIYPKSEKVERRNIPLNPKAWKGGIYSKILKRGDRQTDRQRQRRRETETERGRETDRDRERKTDRQTKRKSEGMLKSSLKKDELSLAGWRDKRSEVRKSN